MQNKQYVLCLIHLHTLLTHSRFYNAHETTGVEEFAIALLCGDVRCDVSLPLPLLPHHIKTPQLTLRLS